MILSIDDPGLAGRLGDVLSEGGVAIMLCDTIYGFIGRAPETDGRIRTIKGRGERNPFLRLVSSVEEAASLADGPLDPRVTALWPAPLTVVLRAPEGTVAVRLPDDPFLRGVIATLGSPIFSTSVNRSGRPPMSNIAEIIGEFERDVDLIVNAGDRPGGVASTILDVSKTPYRVLRKGAFEVPPELLGGR